MSKYRVTLARSARKELEALDDTIVRRIFPAIESLASNPRPSECLKLRGSKTLWRIRVGSYRVIYGIQDEDKVVDVVAVRHRSIAYR
jgi:mRNA interferase RelE/StbE